MDYQQGIRLGDLHRVLGISDDARISVSMSPQGTVIEDLDTNIRYLVPASDPTAIQREPFQVPQYVKDVIALSDAALVEKFRKTLGTPNMHELMALRSECGVRGINPMD